MNSKITQARRFAKLRLCIIVATLGLCAIPTLAQNTAQSTWFENDYVRVSRDAAPCAAAGPGCGERALLAVSEFELAGRRVKPGGVVVFKVGESHETPSSVAYFEIMVKPTRPPVKAPPEMIDAPNNLTLFDSPHFFIYEEILEVGVMRERHSHSQRIEIRINQGPQLSQRVWRDGKVTAMNSPIVNWREPTVHEVINVGDMALRNFILEFKPPR